MEIRTTSRFPDERALQETGAEECDNMSGKNSCYTYFKITGDFDPDSISAMLGLLPSKHWRIGDKRANGTAYDFALWEFGRCDDYDVFVDNQMMRTLQPLLPKIEILKAIKTSRDVSFTLEIVPSIYVGETAPCLAPSAQVIRFCYETDTDIDIDLALFDSTD